MKNTSSLSLAALVLSSVALAGNYDFSYYTMDTNPNCPSSTTLVYLSGGRNTSRANDPDHTCCKFQQQVTSTAPVEDLNDLNEFSVMLGQTLWSHDTALTDTGGSDTSPYVATCPDGSTRSLSGMAREGENIKTSVTSCLDGSSLYGRNLETLARLSAAYPFLDLSAEDEPPTPESCSVPMANPLNFDENDLYSLGDARGNENSGLTAVHVLWIKRHNQWVSFYQQRHEDFTPKQIFEKARARIVAEIQKVGLEYAQALLGEKFKYQKNLKASKGTETVRLFAEFSHGINRLQHAQLRNDFLFLSEDQTVSDTQSLLNVYFNTEWIKIYKKEAVLNGMLSRKSLKMGMHFVPELLGNFKTGGPNLAVADCSRGREAGFQSYAFYRKQLFGETITSFDDITSDPVTKTQLQEIYGNDGVQDVDLFVGSLAEDHLKDAGCGKTFAAIFKRQLDEMRYHDDAWFENQDAVDRPLSKDELKEIEKITMADILLQSTELNCVPENAMFVASNKNSLLCKTDDKFTSPFVNNGLTVKAALKIQAKADKN